MTTTSSAVAMDTGAKGLTESIFRLWLDVGYTQAGSDFGGVTFPFDSF